jgi:hypothetical protein
MSQPMLNESKTATGFRREATDVAVLRQNAQ